MELYPLIQWETICNTPVGRIKLKSGLWVTVVPKGKFIAVMVQHNLAEEAIFNTPEGVDGELVRITNFNRNLCYVR